MRLMAFRKRLIKYIAKKERVIVLELQKVCKSYGKKVALNDFSYIFENGIYGLLGANGAGKSTLMNLITDNVKRDSGNILYNSKEILDMGASYRELIGYMPQQQGFYENFSARMFLYYMAIQLALK